MSIVCDTGFINIVDPFLNPDSTVWTGSITYTLQYATTVAGATLVEARQVINVSDGIDICLAPGLYTVTYNQSGQRLPVTSQWTVPPTGGPYTIADLEGVGPVTGSLTVTGPFIAMSTVTMTSLINAAARPYVATDSVGLLSTGNLALIAISGSASDLASGTVAAARGGAGTLNGLLKANGAGVVSAAVAGTDYSVATNGTNAQFLTSNGAGGFGTAVSSTGSGSVVLATSPTLTTPDLGTPSVLVLTNATGLPAAAMPGLTGDVTSSAGSVATTVVKINGTTLSGLATGLLKNTTATGVPSIAVAGTDYAVATNGTNGQALTSNGTGGFGTAVTLATVATSGSASDLTSGTLAAARGGAGTLTGILKANGAGVVSAATVVKINGTTLSSLATGLLKNTTATGVPSIAVAGTDLIGGVGNLTTVGSVPYVSASGILNQDAGQFFWDATNNRLGIGTNTPITGLHTVSGLAVEGTQDGGTGLGFTFQAYGGRIQSFNSKPLSLNPLGNTVGIGTTAPAATLHVKSASNEILSDATTGDATLSTAIAGVRKWSFYNQAPGNNLWFYDWTNSVARLVVQPGTATAMTILASGNVGIGTIAPNVRLDVLSGSVNTAADSLTASTMTVTGPNVVFGAAANNAGVLNVETNDTFGANVGGSIGFGGRYTGTAQAQWALIKGAKENATDGDIASYLAFGTRAVAGQVTEKMRITSAGNVGIGTTTPGLALDVLGSARVYSSTADAAILFGSDQVDANSGKISYNRGTANLDITPRSTYATNLIGKLKFSITNSTGAGSALLGTNCPAITLTAPYTWITVTTSDGSTGYMPIWK